MVFRLFCLFSSWLFVSSSSRCAVRLGWVWVLVCFRMIWLDGLVRISELGFGLDC